MDVRFYRTKFFIDLCGFSKEAGVDELGPNFDGLLSRITRYFSGVYSLEYVKNQRCINPDQPAQLTSRRKFFENNITE